jgi:hypothetical protein
VRKSEGKGKEKKEGAPQKAVRGRKLPGRFFCARKRRKEEVKGKNLSAEDVSEVKKAAA